MDMGLKYEGLSCSKRFCRRKYYVQYTILFCMMAVLVYGYFFLYDKSFIFSQNGWADGMAQHYPALCYYAKWLREILKTLFGEHRLVIPEWSFSIGYGSDILTTLNYYVMGDPFNFFSVFVPLRYMQYYYAFMILFRLYCAGIAFSMYSFYRMEGKSAYAAVLSGAFLYVFGTYGMTAGIKHPFFINAMVYFPLLLLGAEQLLKRKKSVLLLITVCISACSNFYFFYMEAILTVFYVILRLFTLYGIKRFKKMLIEILRIGVHAVTGLCMSAVIFLPVMLAVFHDNRFANGKALHLFYPLTYYTSFLAGFLTKKSPGYWSLMGFAAVGLVAVFLLFFRKNEYNSIKAAFVFLTVLLLFPAGSYFLNACSYVASRWVWAYAFLTGYIVVVMWPHLQNMTKGEQRWIFSLLSVWLCLCLAVDNSRTANVAFCMVCGFAVLGIAQMEEKNTGKLKDGLLLMVLFVNIAVNAWYSFSVKNSDTLSAYEDRTKVNQSVMETQDTALAQASQEDKDFFRCSQQSTKSNTSLLSGLHTTQYYWTLSNPAIADSNEQMGILVLTSNAYLDQDARTMLTTLANVRYYACEAKKNTSYVPYGFEAAGNYTVRETEWTVYKNQHSLPFGYTYDKVLNEKEFEKLTSVQKEEALLQGILLEEMTDIPETDISLQDEEIPFEIVCPDHTVTCQEQSFVATSDKKSITLNIQGKAECEIFLVINGLEYHGCSPLELYEDDSVFDPLDLYSSESWAEKGKMQQVKEKYKNRNWKEPSVLSITVSGTDEEKQTVSRTLYHYTPEYTWYMGKEDYVVNLGYSNTPKKTITISLPEAGIYSYTSLKVVCRPLNSYAERVSSLAEEHLENVVFGIDSISGDITVSSDKVLCLSIPYSDGWTACVDGVKTDILKANIMYSGILLEKGTHRIELHYRTPGLRLGLFLSITGVFMLLGIICVVGKRK